MTDEEPTVPNLKAATDLKIRAALIGHGYDATLPEFCDDCGGPLHRAWMSGRLETLILQHDPTCPQIPKEAERA